MQVRYKKWLELNIKHSYFAIDHLSTLITPTQATSEVLKNKNIRLRESDMGHEFYIGTESDANDIAAELENLGILEFEIVVNDPLFYNYTDISRPNPEEFFLFRNLTNNSEIQMEIASYQPEEQLMNQNHFGRLQIKVDDLITDQLTLSFHSRKAFQKYLIIIDESRNIEVVDIYIKDSNDELFMGPSYETFLNNQPAIAFISKEAIPLKNAVTNHSTLFMRYQNSSLNTQELKMKLPNPSPESLKNPEEDQFITEAIVYI